MWAATPVWERMPTPMTGSLATRGSVTTRPAPTTEAAARAAASTSLAATVRERFGVPTRLMSWTIMSTKRFSSAIGGDSGPRIQAGRSS